MNPWAIAIGVVLVVIGYISMLSGRDDWFDTIDSGVVKIVYLIFLYIFGFIALMFIRYDYKLFFSQIGIVVLGFLMANIVVFILLAIFGVIWEDYTPNAMVIIICLIHFLTTIVGPIYIYNTFVAKGPTQAEIDANIVTIEEPLIEEKRYDILAGSDIEFIDGDFNLGYGKVNSQSYYKIYYPEKRVEDGETIIVPMKLPANDVELVLLDETAEYDYLIEIKTRYYKEDRNKEPYEKIFTKTVTKYKLYIRDVSFTNSVMINGD